MIASGSFTGGIYPCGEGANARGEERAHNNNPHRDLRMQRRNIKNINGPQITDCAIESLLVRVFGIACLASLWHTA